jgi:(p)ppGpp synthase/HD superfamily hydrolase
MNHWEEAQSYITEAKKLIDQQQEIFINLEGTRLRLQGDLQFIQGDYESALQSCQNALTCFVSPNPVVLHSQALIFLSLGRIYTMVGDFVLAQENLESAYAIFEKSQMIDHKIRVGIYLARLSAFFNPEDAYKKNQELLDMAEKRNVKSILITCLEAQATIAEKRLLEKAFDFFQDMSEEEKTQQQKYLIDQVYNYYDKVIDHRKKADRDNEDIKGITYFKVKKYLWLFAVKYFCGTPPSSDEAYQILSSEQFAKDLFEIELINLKFLLENVRAINSKIADKVSRFSLDMLAPIAMRFGFNNLREIIEDKALAFLYPEDYLKIQEWLTQHYPDREELIQEIHSELEDALEEARISAKILPRIKTVYSIYKKSKERRVPLDKIIDVLGFRVVTKNKNDCYQILKIIQDMGQFFEGKGILKESLRDYIKNPKKTTGYQSIHINILYGQPEAQIVEFQIRTDGMQLAAEYGGISILGLDKVSHARYKSENFYGRASAKKNYELDNRVRTKISIDCTKNIVLNVGRIIQESKFDIFSMDDIFQSSDNHVTMKLELIAKGTRLSKNPQDEKDAIQELQDKLDGINAIQNGYINTRILRNGVENNDFQKISLSLEEKTLLIQELTRYWSGDNSYIYAITPKGDIKKISKPNLIKDNNEQKPQEISCIDFAYAIHEEVGNHCYAAKINNEIVKLNTSIGNGDVVEIITRKNISPNPTWLSFAATSSARNKIRRALKNINREQNIIKGRESLYKEIQKKEHGVNKQEIDRFLKSELMDYVLRLCNYSSADTLLAAIGNKDISKEHIANKILEYRKTQIGKEDGTNVEDEISVKSKISSKHSAPIKSLFNEIEGILYNFAGCCDPLPGNPIVGIIPSRYVEGHNRGIVIHCQSCTHWQNVHKERQISLTWNEKTLPVKIRMKMMNRVGLLSDVLSYVKKMKINVRNTEAIKYDSDNTATITLILDMSTSEELEGILRKIKSMEDCISAYRVND